MSGRGCLFDWGFYGSTFLSLKEICIICFYFLAFISLLAIIVFFASTKEIVKKLI